MGEAEHHAECSSQSGTGWCDCRGLPITLAALEPGLPLTTGEGNTARDERKPMVPDTYIQVTTREWLAHQRRTETAEAECGRLREQLDAARQALAEYEKAVQEALAIAPRHWQRYRDTFELGGEIRAARVVGRAALGVEGPAG